MWDSQARTEEQKKQRQLKSRWERSEDLLAFASELAEEGHLSAYLLQESAARAATSPDMKVCLLLYQPGRSTERGRGAISVEKFFLSNISLTQKDGGNKNLSNEPERAPPSIVGARCWIGERSHPFRKKGRVQYSLELSR